MSITIEMKSNPQPCGHVNITLTEDGKERKVQFHDSNFEDDDFVPDEDSKEIFKLIKAHLKVTGKLLSESVKDFDKKIVTSTLEDE